MKKIEEEATNRFGTGLAGLAGKNGFMEGAEYVLDAMTSKAAATAVDRVRILRTSTLEQLAAVRKEIEGE